MDDIISVEAVNAVSPIGAILYKANFPDGLTLTQMEKLKDGHGWIRRFLEVSENERAKQ